MESAQHSFLGRLNNELVCTSRKPKNFKQYSNLDFNPEFSIQFRTYVHPKNLKRERNNPQFKYFTAVSIHWGCLKITSLFRVLGM